MALNDSSNSNYINQTGIALWGPTGAGKDWLFRSFRKELDYYNNRDEDFNYELLEQLPGEDTPMPLPVEIPHNAPSPDQVVDINYIFRRQALIQDEAHKISSHVHNLIIHNNSGRNLIKSLEDPIAFESTYQTLIHAHSLFLVLGIPTEERGPLASPTETQPSPEPDEFALAVDKKYTLQVGNGNGTDNSSDTDLPREVYLNFMKLLFSVISTGPRRNLAICMTKSDLLNFRGNPWDMLERRHGSALRHLLKVQNDQHNIEVFATSAAGYFRVDSKVVPNLSNAELRDPGHWSPVNTAAPFFWIFEKIERERLKQGLSLFRPGYEKKYISYPIQRPF